MHLLTLNAELDNVTDLKFDDSTASPYEFSFRLMCTSCREIHPNWVSVNQYEKHSMVDSRGEASFLFRCKSCKRQSTATIEILNKPYTLEDSGNDVDMVKITARGLEFTEFNATSTFVCKGADSNTQFRDVDLEENEWYDYDEKAGQEVSITEVKWNIVKGKA